jgi:ligand-binding sensor domain-containing protein/signal transduction histidine kinase
MGTWDGLNRFDGYGFKVYKHDPQDIYSLSNNTIWEIYEDREGILWIGTDDGLNKFDRDKELFIRYKHDPEDPNSLIHNIVGRIYEDSTGQLWVGTWGGGLDRFDRNTGKFIHYQSDPKNPESLSSNIVGDIFEDSHGNLWIGTWNGLDKLDPETEKFSHYRHVTNNPNTLANNTVHSIGEDKTGALWIGMIRGGLDKFNTLSGQFKHYQSYPEDSNTISDNTIWDIKEDASGRLWVGTNGGLNLYQPQTDQFLRYIHNPDNPVSISSPIVFSIIQDHSGGYWIGTDNGVNVSDRTSELFIHYRNEPGYPKILTNNNVWSIYEDLSGTLWVGTSNGLNKYDKKTGQFSHYYHNPYNSYSLNDNWVKSIFQSMDGTLWVGTNQGLNQYDAINNRFIPYRDNSEIKTEFTLNQQYFFNFADYPNLEDATWFGMIGTGLLKLGPTTKQMAPYSYSDNNPGSLSGTIVEEIYQDRQGILWIGTDKSGLIRFSRASGRFTRYTSNPDDPKSLSDNTTYTILQDHSNVLWIGTRSGLNRFEPTTQIFTHFRQKDGLPSDVIYGLLEDNQGFLWMSTDKGLSRFDPKTSAFKNFDRQDGLQSNEFNPGAYFKNHNGEMFFGGINGFIVFTPEQIKDNPYIPTVVLTALTQGGEKIQLNTAVENLKEVTFYWPYNYFEFEFAALSYIQPEKNQYAYKLENLEPGWNLVGTRRYGSYTNLPGGTYMLRIKGSNNDGVWNEQGPSLKVTIVPPFWQTTWFRLGLILVLVAGLFAGYRLRVHSIENINRRLSVQVEERTREIEQRRQVAEGLREVLLLLNSNQSLKESLNFIVRQVNNLVKAETVCIFQSRNKTKVEIVAAYSRLGGEDGTGIGKNGAGWDYQDQVLSWFAELITDSVPQITISPAAFLLEHPVDNLPCLENIQTILIIPIVAGEDIFGGLAVMFANQKELSEEELELLHSFTDQAALAIGNSQLRSQAEEMAVVSERNRLARDLHDAVTQTLFSASLIAEAIPAVWISDQQEGLLLLKELRQLNRGALAEMRALLMELRPTAVMEVKLPDLLHQLTEAVTGRTGMIVNLDIRGSCNLPSDVHVGLYRITQEALTNVVKHAHATKVLLRLWCEPSNPDVDPQNNDLKVLLEVIDDGCGFDLESVLPDHFGLVNIRERAQAIGTKLEITSQPGAGTHVRAFWQGKAVDHD